MTFGIPSESMPVTYEGVLKTYNHVKWIERRRAKDGVLKATGEFHGVDMPGWEDVLFGRGRNFSDHPGSVKLRNIVNHYLEDYQRGNKATKEAIGLRIRNTIRDDGGRFLKRNDDGFWVEVPEEAILSKIGMSFRTILSVARKQAKANAEAAAAAAIPDAPPSSSASSTTRTENGKRAKTETTNSLFLTM